MNQSLPTRVMSRTLHHVDLFLMCLSGGRVSIPGTLGGLPVVRLTTVGAKTGKERTVPLLGIRDGETWAVVASNWGGESHPAWYHNLRTNPEVSLSYRGRTNRYVAREATETERGDYWKRAREMYPEYETYERTAGDRRIPIVMLAPTEG